MSGRRFHFTHKTSDGNTRLGQLETAHGAIQTPAFMPVGTAATVKAMTPEAVARTGAEIVLANTYHLMLRPGPERIAGLGGLHTFMNWPGPILTDSGGYQVWSLAKLRKITEEGVTFQSHIDGSAHELTPERAIKIQELLDSDITMVLDECTDYPAMEKDAEKSMQLSLRWAERCKTAFHARPGYGLFGIVQGGMYPKLRAACADGLVGIGFDGYAIGGLSVGEPRDEMFAMLDATTKHLPADKPRYLMGVGRPEDILGAVARGIDMFDCVLPTRSGRNGKAFTRRGEINIRNARHADDPRPLDENCACPTCADYSRAYLHHLVKSEEILGCTLMTGHNLHFYQDLMSGIREAITENNFENFSTNFLDQMSKGDIGPHSIEV
ncbi:MAG: tRNA guanosine(34) transglycosylase Tgt [Rhodospirillaceae bacterium]|nr:tRNA guanosine(34) transglycosylase Tgt [Rhodospirillaceae bacterium]MBT5660381.1 tRNA guanosine(34) transglycosylase Tgt [Rhodospirillaceae bacterium]MBT5751385.1 tRNA guanosine(34) transglycosylase Tgt [Rhodospirillaceae bacterium]